ncbi:kinase-like domain-containing protein [Aspergillus californicus]
MLPPYVIDALEKADRQKLELADVGCYSQVINIPDTEFVIKQNYDHPISGNLQAVERRIYERLGHHPYVLRYYGEYHLGNGLPDGLVVQHHAAEALRYIHSKNVVHCEVGSHNFLVQDDGNLVLVDFGGPQIDETPPQVSYATRYARPCLTYRKDDHSTEVDDIFALGTPIYEISVGHALYPDKSCGEIHHLFQQHTHPNLDALPLHLRVVISKCWSNEYLDAKQVICDLEATPAPSYPHIFCLAGLSIGVALTVLFIIKKRTI